jgi:hypothetical protein
LICNLKIEEFARSLYFGTALPLIKYIKEKEIKMNNKVQGLSAKELLEGVYNAFKRDGKEVKLPAIALTEIAIDSDWPRSCAGYTKYDSAIILKIGNKRWAIALGTAYGSYLADPYNCDIVAVPISNNEKSEDRILAEIYVALERNKYFRDSLVYAMVDGQLYTKESGRFGKDVIRLLKPKVRKFIAKDLEVDPDRLTTGLRPVIKSAVQYKPKFVGVLYNIFRTIITS